MKFLYKFAGLVAISALIIVACSKNQNVTPMSQTNPSLKSTESNSSDIGNTIQSGKIHYPAGFYLAGQTVKTGYNSYGYNFQAHMFNGWYINSFLDSWDDPPYNGDPASYLAQNLNMKPLVRSNLKVYGNTKLMMKWNDAYWSNKDINGNGLLDDYPYGFPSYKGSGAWYTVHTWGIWNINGKKIRINEFYKVIAVPEDATLKNGIWYSADGKKIGAYAGAGLAQITDNFGHLRGWYGAGIDILSPDHNGLGGW